ncbi:synaptopodin [Heptranchias perlo]|uniref:synaptopodin n=1 Tax=Heptranchias perlo TaxID=212740 RepID=UPI00355A80A3
MQVGADVHSCGYFSQARAEGKPRSEKGWSAGEASLSLSITDHQRQGNYLGNLGDEEECESADTVKNSEPRTTEGLWPGSTTSAFGKAAAGQSLSALKEAVCPVNVPSDRSAASKTESTGTGEWRAPNLTPRVIPGVAPHQKPANLCRSLSVTEQEVKEAKIQSQKIAAQLTTPPSANSKGVLLFNKRKKRVNEFTLTSYGKQELQSGAEASPPVNGDGGAPRDRLAGGSSVEPRGSAELPSSSEETSVPYFERRVKEDIMEASMAENHVGTGILEERKEEAEDCAAEEEGEEECREGMAGECKDVTEECGVMQDTADLMGESPLETNDLLKPVRSTMEVHLETSHLIHEPDKVYMDLPGDVKLVNNQIDGDKISESQEVYAPEEKQPLVMNRTPKPFLSEVVSPKPFAPQVGPPTGSPVYSSPPPVSRITSPPPFANSFPTAVGQSAGYTNTPSVSANKTGILEESRMRRAARKPMFTFHEKPKVAPNPELLSLVQGIDVKKKSGQAESLNEEDYLSLGAEACTFAHQKASPPAASKQMASGQDGPPIPEWASCLKPPELRAPRRSGATQTLMEVKGKGAELFARRQSRMERYTFESSPARDNPPPRPPSPTMSLPPSWKCHDNGRTSPAPQHGPPRSLRVGSRPPPSAFAQVNKSTPGGSSPRAGADLGSHQLSSSLYIISPNKSPLTSLPRAAPSPPKPVVPGAVPYARQASAPPSSRAPPFVAAKPPSVPPSPAGVNGFGDHSPSVDIRSPGFEAAPASPAGSSSPRPKDVTQAPRPSFSARRAGLEPQTRTSPAAQPWKPSLNRRLSSPQTYSETLRTQPANNCSPGSPRSPFHPISPTVITPSNWSPLRDPKPGSPARPGGNSAESRRLKDLLAKNVVSAARRKKLSSPTSPSDLPSPLSPRAGGLSPLSPLSGVSLANANSPTRISPARSPLKLYRRSLTDSDFSVGSDDSGPRSPSYYNFCPRGWSGSKMRQSDQL